MHEFDLYKLAQVVCNQVFRHLVPYDTGNMALQATKVEKVSENEVKIFVDSAVAPYVVYTNEPWISPRWRGKENPNEKWFERATEKTAQAICSILGGEITISSEEENDTTN